MGVKRKRDTLNKTCKDQASGLSAKVSRWSPGPAPPWGDTGNGSLLWEGESGFAGLV